MSDKPSLLSLPMEIRLQIYSYLDHDDSPIMYPLSGPYCSQASFILTCRQLRYEMQHDFFSHNVFAIRYTKLPSLEELDILTKSLSKIKNFDYRSTDSMFDISLLESYVKQSFTDVRPFDRCGVLSDDLKRIENIQLHAVHWRLYAINRAALYRLLPEYVSKCREQLEIVLEALVHSKNMKGPLGLRTLTVVDHVPCIPTRCGNHVRPRTMLGQLGARLAAAYEPVLTQAAATLGNNIKDVKVHLSFFTGKELVNESFRLASNTRGSFHQSFHKRIC